jgi:hypothetical protein
VRGLRTAANTANSSIVLAAVRTESSIFIGHHLPRFHGNHKIP